MDLELVVAFDSNRGIGRSGTIPWSLPTDLKHFAELTTTAPEGFQNIVIMGRKTWESIPERFRPLRNRINIVLTKQLSAPNESNTPGVYFLNSLEQAFEYITAFKCTQMKYHKVFVIGGSQLYQEAMSYASVIHVTWIYGVYDCDTFFPVIPKEYTCTSDPTMKVENGISFCFMKFSKNQNNVQNNKENE